MRYVLEPKNNRGRDALTRMVADEDNIELIGQYEPMEKLSREVEQIGIALRQFKDSGVEWDVFIYYMKGKGHSLSTINGVMGDVQEFFKKLGMLE